MEINTLKIKKEMERLGLTLETLGQRFKPRMERCAVSYVINHASSLARITDLAKALDMDPKDLIKR